MIVSFVFFGISSEWKRVAIRSDNVKNVFRKMSFCCELFEKFLFHKIKLLDAWEWIFNDSNGVCKNAVHLLLCKKIIKTIIKWIMWTMSLMKHCFISNLIQCSRKVDFSLVTHGLNGKLYKYFCFYEREKMD